MRVNRERLNPLRSGPVFRSEVLRKQNLQELVVSIPSDRGQSSDPDRAPQGAGEETVSIPSDRGQSSDLFGKSMDQLTAKVSIPSDRGQSSDQNAIL